MAIETLKGVEKIGGFGVYAWGENGVQEFPVTPGDTFVTVNHKINEISFVLQKGPVKENGINGCQVDTIIHAAKIILDGLNRNIPCKETEQASEYLRLALLCLEERKKDREARGVEGLNKE